MKQALRIIKIGGNVVDNHEALKSFLHDFAKLDGHKILVHGGGKEATRLSASMNIATTMVNGRRVTDSATLDIVTMVYAGLINKRIVSRLQAEGCDAIGLTGADANAICATRRNPIPVDFGFVGDISPDGVNTELISTLIEKEYTPVFCAINHDKNGQLLNCNADSVAAAIAKAMSKQYDVTLIYCFELPGVLSDINDKNSVIPRITPDMRDVMIEKGVIANGMIPKIDNALDAVAYGVNKVIITHADNLTNSDCGTVITSNE